MSASLKLFSISGLVLSCAVHAAEPSCERPTEHMPVESLTHCAEQGFSEAQVILARKYHNGHGTSDSLTYAARWYLRAAESGDPEAQYQIGMMYIDGLGVTEDGFAGFDWISKAALRGHPAAQEVFNYLLENPRPLEC